VCTLKTAYQKHIKP